MPLRMWNDRNSFLSDHLLLQWQQRRQKQNKTKKKTKNNTQTKKCLLLRKGRSAHACRRSQSRTYTHKRAYTHIYICMLLICYGSGMVLLPVLLLAVVALCCILLLHTFVIVFNYNSPFDCRLLAATTKAYYQLLRLLCFFVVVVLFLVLSSFSVISLMYYSIVVVISYLLRSWATMSKRTSMMRPNDYWCCCCCFEDMQVNSGYTGVYFTDDYIFVSLIICRCLYSKGPSCITFIFFRPVWSKQVNEVLYLIFLILPWEILKDWYPLAIKKTHFFLNAFLVIPLYLKWSSENFKPFRKYISHRF